MITYKYIGFFLKQIFLEIFFLSDATFPYTMVAERGCTN